MAFYLENNNNNNKGIRKMVIRCVSEHFFGVPSSSNICRT